MAHFFFLEGIDLTGYALPKTSYELEYQYNYLGNDNYYAEFFGGIKTELSLTTKPINIESDIYRELLTALKSGQELLAQTNDYNNFVIVSNISTDPSETINHTVLSFTLKKTTQGSNIIKTLPSADLTLLKKVILIEQKKDFAKKLKVSTFAKLREKAGKALTAIADNATNVSQAVNELSNGLSNVKSTVTNLQNAIYSPIDSAGRLATSVSNFKGVIDGVFQFPDRVFDGLTSVYSSLVGAFDKPEQSISSLYSLAKFEALEEEEKTTTPILSIDKANVDVLLTIGQTNRIVALTTLFENYQGFVFPTQTELQTILALIEIESAKLTTDNALIQTNFDLAKTNFIDRVKELNSDVPELQTINVINKDNLFNVLYQNTGSLDNLDYVIAKNNIADVMSIEGELLIPVV